MLIQPIAPQFIKPTKGTEDSAGFDIYMPEDGKINAGETVVVPLGFATAIPKGYVALLLPRSGTGFKYGLEVNNTVGVIDADYRGEWKASLKLKNPKVTLSWMKGERLLQFILVPVPDISLTVVQTLRNTERGSGGFGSTGN